MIMTSYRFIAIYCMSEPSIETDTKMLDEQIASICRLDVTMVSAPRAAVS